MSYLLLALSAGSSVIKNEHVRCPFTVVQDLAALELNIKSVLDSGSTVPSRARPSGGETAAVGVIFRTPSQTVYVYEEFDYKTDWMNGQVKVYMDVITSKSPNATHIRQAFTCAIESRHLMPIAIARAVSRLGHCHLTDHFTTISPTISPKN